jgi:hypothetical protein
VRTSRALPAAKGSKDKSEQGTIQETTVNKLLLSLGAYFRAMQREPLRPVKCLQEKLALLEPATQLCTSMSPEWGNNIN